MSSSASLVHHLQSLECLLHWLISAISAQFGAVGTYPRRSRRVGESSPITKAPAQEVAGIRRKRRRMKRRKNRGGDLILTLAAISCSPR
ncbi:hypothetical protein HPP92_007796 [Vanilla planifolia]|uniref:Secreted protein n=1 Tax=Vanilla planifolia TaxID=51239 RepID=A0A835RIV2_VANPL|nr:hypothetical protein HPP92_007796 [Vanilla planifolia]